MEDFKDSGCNKYAGVIIINIKLLQEKKRELTNRIIRGGKMVNEEIKQICQMCKENKKKKNLSP